MTTTIKADLQEAIHHISNLIAGEYCSFDFDRKRWKTCREYKTWQQGKSHPGCFNCEAREFLSRINNK